MTTKKTTTTAGYLRPADAARYLNVSTRCVREWQRKRLLPYSAMGKRCILFRVADLDAAIARFNVNAIGG